MEIKKYIICLIENNFLVSYLKMLIMKTLCILLKSCAIIGTDGLSYFSNGMCPIVRIQGSAGTWNYTKE